jgi:hypothetical protein
MMGAKSSDSTSSVSFCPHHFARMLNGGCLARQIESILGAISEGRSESMRVSPFLGLRVSAFEASGFGFGVGFIFPTGTINR